MEFIQKASAERRRGLGTQWDYSRMQGTEVPRSGDAAQGCRKQRGGSVDSQSDCVTGNLPSAIREHEAEALCHSWCQVGQEVMCRVPWLFSQQEGVVG